MAGSYLDAVRERVVVFDGAFGTYIQQCDLTAEDFGGPDLEGCNEHVALTRPDVIEGMHRSFLEIGVDAIETATFGAFAVTLGEYGIADKTHEINLAAASIARRVADEHATPDRPRWVAGSMGPGTPRVRCGSTGPHRLSRCSTQAAPPTLWVVRWVCCFRSRLAVGS